MGYCYDEESGLYYLSARHYDPVSMQFLTKDPAKADGEESAYQYCGGDPVGKVDPNGLKRGSTLWASYDFPGEFGKVPFIGKVIWEATVVWRRTGFTVRIRYKAPAVHLRWMGSSILFSVNFKEGDSYGPASWRSSSDGGGVSQGLSRERQAQSRDSRWQSFSITYNTKVTRRIEKLCVHARMSLQESFWNNDSAADYAPSGYQYVREKASLLFRNPQGTRWRLSTAPKAAVSQSAHIRSVER